jgi:hypothetical protein
MNSNSSLSLADLEYGLRDIFFLVHSATRANFGTLLGCSRITQSRDKYRFVEKGAGLTQCSARSDTELRSIRLMNIR